MIVGPSPQLSPIDADRIARALRRGLREAAGARADEVRSRGGGRLSIPADLFIETAPKVPHDDVLNSGDVVVLVSIDPSERALLMAAWVDSPADGPDSATVYDAGDGEPATDLTWPDSETVWPDSETVWANSGGEPPVSAETVDPSSRDQFPNIDALVAFARDHGIDIAGRTRRPELEHAIQLYLANQSDPSITTP